MVVDNGIIEKLFFEAGQRDNADSDPYEATTPENVLDYVKSTVRETATV
jgi:peroxiredoxin